jgi:hypothetical protein
VKLALEEEESISGEDAIKDDGSVEIILQIDR